MFNLSNYSQLAILNSLFGKTSSFGALASAPSLAIGLLTAAPTNANNGASVTEANYTGYARVAAAAGAWAAASGASPASISNSSAITFPTCTAGSSTITNFGMFDTTTLPISAPTISSATQGGTAGSTTYRYILTATNAVGETVGGAEVNVTNGNATLSAGNPITVNWTQITGATGYKLYRTLAGGATNTEVLLATIGSGATVTYSDQGTTPSGASPPTVNSTGGNLIAWGTIQTSQAISAGNVTSATASGVTTVTVTLANHGYSTGNTIFINGANQPAYNGSFTITVTGSNTFTYTIGTETAPVSPATGTITAAIASSLAISANITPSFAIGALSYSAD